MAFLQSITNDQFSQAKITTPDLSFYYGFSGVPLIQSLSDFVTELAQELPFIASLSDIESRYQQLLSGEHVNTTEDRPVTHHACRHPNTRPALDKLTALQNTIADSPFNRICHIGIGGSHTGPEALYHALCTWGTPQSIPCQFISSHDEDHIASRIPADTFATTLFTVASKSGTTIEIEKIMDHICHTYNVSKAEFLAKQCIAITTPDTPLHTTPTWDTFLFDTGIGGRFSSTTYPSLVPLALCFGTDVITELLDGAYAMDQCSQIMDANNLPLIQALLQVRYRNQLHYPGLALVPYGEALVRFSPFATQLIAESLGKPVPKNADNTAIITAPIILSGMGPNAQHSFFQQLHQATPVTPVDFIIVQPNSPNQTHMLQQVVGQMATLAESDRPSTCTILTQGNARSLGALIAAYENRVMFESFLLGINAFDQPGVERGKQVTNAISNGEHALAEGMFTGMLNA
jgi:glucose-6-phosphate isomerase